MKKFLKFAAGVGCYLIAFLIYRVIWIIKGWPDLTFTQEAVFALPLIFACVASIAIDNGFRS